MIFLGKGNGKDFTCGLAGGVGNRRVQVGRVRKYWEKRLELRSIWWRR